MSTFRPDPPYYIEPALRADLERMRQLVLGSNDEDVVIIVDGRERAGKSVLALQIAAYLDSEFGQDAVPKNVEAFIDFVVAHKKRVVIFDEAILGFFGKRSREERNVFLDQLLALCGQQNLFVILVAPFIFDFNMRTAVGRSEMLIHVFRVDYRRGHYRVYDYNDKRKLFILGRKEFNYDLKGVEPSYHGTFQNIYSVDETIYRQEKRQGFVDFVKGYVAKAKAQNKDLTGEGEGGTYTGTQVKEFVNAARLLEYELLRSKGWLAKGAGEGRAAWGGMAYETLIMRVSKAVKLLNDAKTVEMLQMKRVIRNHPREFEVAAALPPLVGENSSETLPAASEPLIIKEESDSHNNKEADGKEASDK